MKLSEWARKRGISYKTAWRWVRQRKMPVPLLARPISDMGWGEFLRQLAYKCVWKGSRLVTAPRSSPSSKRCSGCGYVLEQLPLPIREWTCLACGRLGGKGRLWRSEARGRKAGAGRGNRKQPRQMSSGYLSRSCRTV
jgi:hypothetical protein